MLVLFRSQLYTSKNTKGLGNLGNNASGKLKDKGNSQILCILIYLNLHSQNEMPNEHCCGNLTENCVIS